MTNFRLRTLSLVICLLAACAPSQQTIQTAVAQTQEDWTPTRIPLSKINLRPIVFIPGDLPADFTAGQFQYDIMPEVFNDVTGYMNAFDQEFKINGDKEGGVTVLLFDSIDRRDSAYSVLTDTFGKIGVTYNYGAKLVVAQSSDAGEKAMYNIMSSGTSNTSQFLFLRCQAIALITLIDKGDLPTITNYAKRLDKRLNDLICQ